ncbi:MAG: hypothetical protein O8C66_03025 [Candidatus Methanoperedens sp.]|nr:hypothetical protein [Candidatus Methanoperedens sp.]MCZ7369460.1 hypothetical protein [Candidatus Methanoperedens sp.]
MLPATTRAPSTGRRAGTVAQPPAGAFARTRRAQGGAGLGADIQ